MIELIVLAYTRSLIFYLSLPLLDRPCIKFIVPSSKAMQLIKSFLLHVEFNLNYQKLVSRSRTRLSVRLRSGLSVRLRSGTSVRLRSGTNVRFFCTPDQGLG
jgi:hypothetical protein